MRSLVLAVLGSMLALAPAAPASAEPVVVLDRDDARGDVDVLAPRRTRAERHSIDLERAWATTLDDGSARFAVRLRDLADRGTRWEQVVTVQAEHPDVEPFMVLAFSHRPRQGGTAYSEATAQWCEDLTVRRHPARDVLAAVVPADCLPGEGWRVDVRVEAGQYRAGSLGASRAWSRDDRRLGRWPGTG